MTGVKPTKPPYGDHRCYTTKQAVPALTNRRFLVPLHQSRAWFDHLWGHSPYTDQELCWSPRGFSRGWGIAPTENPCYGMGLLDVSGI